MLPPSLSRFSRVYVMNVRLDGAGFGSMLLQTINQIRYCERNNFLPVANYDQDCRSYFLDRKRGDSVWDQYFEPLIPGVSYADVERWCADPNHPLDRDDLLTLPDEEMIAICEHDPDSAYTYTFADWRSKMPTDLKAWYREQRDKGSDIIKRFVRVKTHIRNKVDEFRRQHFAEHPVLGIHIRGTDMTYAPPVSPPEYFPHIDGWLQKFPDGRIFVATDQAQYLEVFEKRYRNLTLSSDSWRSRDELVPLYSKKIGPYQRGEDPLIDLLLLSSCAFLLKGASNIGEMALYFNPELKCEDLSLGKRWAFGQDYGEGWNGSLPEDTKTAWGLMKNRELDVMASDTHSQSTAQRWAYFIRPWWTWLPKWSNRGIRFLRRTFGQGSGQNPRSSDS